MKKGLLLILGLLFFVQANAYFTLKEIKIDSLHSFTSFHHKRAKKASKNINDFLQLSLLQTILNDKSAGIEDAWHFSIHVNNKNFLSISAKNSANVEKHFVFNAATGSIIAMQDMFTANGIAFIKRTISKQLKVNEDETLVAKEKCIKDDLQNYLLRLDTFIVYPSHCLSAENNTNHALAFGFSNVILSRYLSTYGQAMFAQIRKPKMKKLSSAATIGLYHGKLNNEDIILQLNNPIDKSLSGTLYYTKSNKAIALSGSFKNNRFETDIDNGRLSLIISAGRIEASHKQGNKLISNFKLEKQ